MDVKLEFISASISDRGLSEKRPQNEDSFAELPEHGIFAVADGVGGAMAGDVASQMAMEILTEAAINRGIADAEDLFRMAIGQANQAIHQMAAELPQLSMMATTIAALHLNGNIATIAHVGDSRVYRIAPDGQVFRETNDHSVVEEEVRAGRMTAEEAMYHPARNVISRAVGAEAAVEIDIKTIMVEPNTSFLLCSDGITRHVPDNEIAEVFANGSEPGAICRNLKELCYERGAEDNLTAVVVRTYGETVTAEHETAVLPTEPDEETVASAREHFDDTIAVDEETFSDETAPDLVGQDLVDTGDLTGAEPEYIEESTLTKTQQLPDNTEDVGSGEPDAYTSASLTVPATQSEEPFSIFGTASQAVSNEPETAKRRGAGSVIIPLLMLVLGGVIGAGAALFSGWNPFQQPVEPPQVETMGSRDIPLTTFEELRRAVDRDPQGYASKNPATPQDAGDHYLLGRALLLSGKPLEARRQFELAREQIPQAEESERKTLETEIALAMAVVEDAQATESFTKALAPPANAVNANSRGAANR